MADETPILLKIWSGAVHFLIEHFNFLGFEIQNWMLIVIALIAVFLFFVRKARDRF